MPRLHAVELLPDAAGEAAVRRDWQALRDAGLPSQLDVGSATNAPHLTVLALPGITGADEQRAVDLLGPLLPVTVRTSGLGVLGRDRLTVVRLVDVEDPLLRAVLDLRAVTSGHQHPGWLPHLTLVRRLPRADLQRAVDVLGAEDVVVTLSALRRWDPEAAAVRGLWPPGPGPQVDHAD